MHPFSSGRPEELHDQLINGFPRAMTAGTAFSLHIRHFIFQSVTYFAIAPYSMIQQAIRRQ